ncbi:MAG TPA: glycosyltransferase family 2 protein [Pyrinomonadaceae bacterium]|nr:glycosyltransferase family 2 protein [Pyrinomonadaceae bacterium]
MNADEKAEKIVELSVVIASLFTLSDLKNCLDGILEQSRIASSAIEIIVEDCCLKEKTAEWIEEFPAVEFVEFPPKTSLAVLLGAGIARAKGEIIAVTDSSCVVADDWISSILRSHEAKKSPVIGGAVEMSENGKLTDWAAYFCDYGEFMPIAPRGIAAVIPGNNFSVKRAVLQRGTEFVAPEFWKTLWCRQLQSEGIELFSEPAIRVGWRKTYKLNSFLVRRFHQGRCFAGMRFAEQTFSRRIFYSVVSIFLPLIFLYRIAAPVLRRKRFFEKFILSFPIIVLAVVFWSVGEAFGFLAGTGTSCGRID